MDYYMIWLIVMVVSLVVEAATLGLTTIWFALGAFVAMILSLLGVTIGFQIASFIIISIACLIFIYPMIKNKLFLGKEKTNYEAIINKAGIVVVEVNNLKNVGQVKVSGQIWSAKSMEDCIIEVGKKVIIQDVIGVKLIVTEN